MENEPQTMQQPVSTETRVQEVTMDDSKGKKFFSVKMAVIVAIILVIAGLAFAFKGMFFAATVNGHPITRLAVISELEKRSGKEALANLISQSLVEGEIRDKGIKVTDDEVNAEIKKVEDQIKTTGSTLDKELIKAGMTMNDLKKQTIITKSLEKLLADKIQVTDTDVENYVKASKETLPKGKEAEAMAYLKQQMQQQKFNEASKELISGLLAKSNITYFVDSYRQ